MTDSQAVALSTLITGVVTLGTIVWRDIAAYYRAKQLHQWDLEHQAAVARRAEQMTQGIHVSLAENTALTQQVKAAADAAYEVANTVNLKLEKLGIERQDELKAQGREE